MYAIIETDGKQYRVKEGDLLRCDAVGLEPGSSISFDRVVLASAGGSAVTIGKPHVAGASVSGTVVRQAKDKKIMVMRYKSKKRQRKLNGHRQLFAEVRIDKIEIPA
jgi:large subunit ribosomal protein L21